jgi:hypothetical protein
VRAGKRTATLAAAAVAAAVLLLPGAATPASRGLADSFLGPNLVRAEAFLKVAGTTFDYRLDRGRILRKAGGSLVLLEGDGTTVTVAVSPTARILVDGVVTTFVSLRRGMTVTTVRNGDAAAEALYVRGKVPGMFLGGAMVRAEVAVKIAATLHDYRLDRGRIRAVGPGSLTLLERDATTVTIQVSATATVTLNGRIVPLLRLRRGMEALTIRDGDAPAERVQAIRR